ncbi:CBS domain protein [Planctomycetes bacterium CA13]|uniref:CBS domain protein n=1 Tax=Novipirellula herctigrandis TaxID=2527986 RepID=A0A5C5YY17_9BACT|nr:CBS domain protein [Planctomycetes bacterium CA13]
MKMPSVPKTDELMQTGIHSIEPETVLADVVSYLTRHRLANVLVIRVEDGKKLLLGYISEADCMEHLSNELFYGSPMPIQTAATIMQKHPLCVTSDTDIFVLSSVFISHKCRFLPVVDDKHLLGMVCRSDALKALDQYYRQWVRLHDQERKSIDVHEIMNHRFLVRS